MKDRHKLRRFQRTGKGHSREKGLTGKRERTEG